MKPLSALVILAAAGMASGQTGATQPGFEIADVHLSPASRYPAMRAAVRAGRYEIKTATMADLIAAAYGIEPDKVLGGPNWLELDRFDITAKAPANTQPPALRLMTQALLADRFHLRAHMDQRPMPAFVLSRTNRKPLLKEPDASTPPGCRRQPEDAGVILTVCHGLTMQAFVQQLRGLAGDYLTRPSVDNTSLEGAWDFTLKWTPRSSLTAAGSGGITIFEAIDKQLGLKLEPREMPAPVLVVDNVNRRPTTNSPDVATVLPASPPPRFEVATIKPTESDFRGVRTQISPAGQVNFSGLTLGYMIQTIWFVTPEMIVGAPAWLDTDRWDIAAKIGAAPGSPPATDMDSMIVMVRALFEDRFSLKTHMEERAVPALTLTAIKPRLQKADPTSRTSCKEGPGADGKDPRIANPALSRLVTCRNLTMAQFAQQLPGIANALNPLNGYIRSAVADETGLEGAWDFTLSFTQGLGITPNTGPAPAADQPPVPNGALSVDEAIRRQLGLNLAIQKRPAQVLVIDHIERKPSGN